MEQPTLFLQKNVNSDWESFNRFSEFSNSSLWKIVETINIHLFLQEPALLELARRKDSRVSDFCEKMLISNDPDECFIAIQILVELGSKQAIERLFHFYLNCNPLFKSVALHGIAKNLSPEYTEYFSKLVAPLACTGILDISTWSPIAIEALEKICKRKSIRVIEMYNNTTPISNSFLLKTQNKRSIEKQKSTRTKHVFVPSSAKAR
jgi:hypothetical protein